MQGRVSKPDAADNSAEQPFVSHLLELRSRLLRALAAVLVIVVALLPFANDLYTLVAGPLLAHMPQGSSMIAIEVASPFLAPFKFTLVLAVFIAMPVILYQIWAFVAPGLYRHEQRLVLPLLVSSSVLFYAGMAFAFFVVFPMVFGFFTSTAPHGVAVMTDINKYLDFVLTMFFAFGVAFEIPIATVILVWIGAITPKKLSEMRPYVIVGVFVAAAVLTPPDVVTQTMLAVPMWLLFEAGVYISRMVQRRHQTAAEGAQTEEKASSFGDAEMEAELDRIDEEERRGPTSPD